MTTMTRVANAKAGEGGAAAAVEEPKKSKKKLMIIVFVVLLAGGYYHFMMGKKAVDPNAKPVPGIVVPMDATTLNLADGHFLKLKVAIQTVKGVKAEMDVSEAADIIVDEFSNRPMAGLVTTESRDKVKKDLVRKLQVAYPKEIIDVYFTEFVMQ